MSDSLDRGVQVDVIYTDFSKAFDQVDHSTDSTQAVILQGVDSDVIEVTSGVPQGSHLGLLLFSNFINDFVNNIKYCESLLFFDDAKLFKRTHLWYTLMQVIFKRTSMQ